jgi:hypothetical protein
LKIFYYFIPDVVSAAAAKKKAKAAGLYDYAFEEGKIEPTTGEIHGGPGDLNGFILYDVRGESHLGGYYKDKQTWLNCGDFWLGWYTSDPPREEDLRLEKMLPSHPVALGNGEEWQIPKAIVFNSLTDWSNIIPKKFKVVDGEADWFNDEKYDGLVEVADRWLNASEQLDSGETPDWPNGSQILPAVVAVMKNNYRVRYNEIAALELVDSDNWPKIFNAVLDNPGYEELKKKA